MLVPEYSAMASLGGAMFGQVWCSYKLNTRR
jgi:hypothetical protein